jgi:hypothetical protein
MGGRRDGVDGVDGKNGGKSWREGAGSDWGPDPVRETKDQSQATKPKPRRVNESKELDGMRWMGQGQGQDKVKVNHCKSKPQNHTQKQKRPFSASPLVYYGRYSAV